MCSIIQPSIYMCCTVSCMNRLKRQRVSSQLPSSSVAYSGTTRLVKVMWVQISSNPFTCIWYADIEFWKTQACFVFQRSSSSVFRPITKLVFLSCMECIPHRLTNTICCVISWFRTFRTQTGFRISTLQHTPLLIPAIRWPYLELHGWWFQTANFFAVQ